MGLGRRFGVLLGSSGLSNLSDGLAFVSMPLIAASMTNDPLWVAGLATIYALTRLMVALPAGLCIDRIDRRTLLVGANLLRAAALLVLALTIHFGAPSLIVLYAVMAVVATLESLADGSSVAILPSLVRRADLDRANSRVTAVQLVTDEFLGPPLAGFLFAVATVLPVYAMAGAWAAAGVLALALPRRIKNPQMSQSTGRSSSFRETADGVRWLVRHRTVGTLSVVGGLASVGYMLPFSVLVIFARDQLGVGSLGYGLLLATSAVGGLIGAAAVSSIRRRWSYRRTITASLCLGSLSLASLTWTTSAALAALLLGLYIFHAVLWNICATSLRQRLVPSDLLGRVGAASRVLSLAGLALGSAVGGILASTDIRLPTALGSVVFFSCVVVALIGLPAADPED